MKTVLAYNQTRKLGLIGLYGIFLLLSGCAGSGGYGEGYRYDNSYHDTYHYDYVHTTAGRPVYINQANNQKRPEVRVERVVQVTQTQTRQIAPQKQTTLVKAQPNQRNSTPSRPEPKREESKPRQENTQKPTTQAVRAAPTKTQTDRKIAASYAVKRH